MEGTAEERLGKRLTSLWDELPDDEKELLLTVLALADDAEAEVSGYSTDLSAVSLLGSDVKSKFDTVIAHRKAGEKPVEFLRIKFQEVFISGVA